MSQSRIDSASFVMRVMFASMLLTVGVYLFILLQVTNGQPPKTIEPVMLYALAGFSASIMVVIPILRSKLLPPTKEATSLSETVPDNDQTSQALGRVFTATIVSWALCEAIAIFGLVLTFLSFDLRYFYPFAAASLVNFVIYRPRKELMLGAARAAG